MRGTSGSHWARCGRGWRRGGAREARPAVALRRAAETNDQPRSAALTLCGHRRPPDVALVAFLGSLDRLRVPDLDSPIAPSPLHSTPSASGRSPFILAPPRDASPLPAGQERPEDHPNRRARAPAPLTPLQLFDRLDGCA